MTFDAIRDQFPFLKSGRIYLNHAATSPWSSTMEQEVLRFIDMRARGDIEIYPVTMNTITETRDWAAEMIGCEAADLSFALNTSEGLNILAAGLDWKHGDHIVLVDQEFPANIYPFLNLRRHGVDVSLVSQRDGSVSIEDIERAMTPRTRLVAVSWVQFLSGYVIDLSRLKAMCEYRGALLSVDAIQGIGAIRLDVRTTPVDFLSAGVQKWQMGPQGVGIVYTAPHLRAMLNQAVVGWINVKNAWDFFDYKLDLLDDARRYESGTYNSIGITGYHGALKLFREVGYDRVEELVRANAAHAWQRAKDMGFELITPGEPSRRAGIVTFRLPDADRVQQQLLQRGITVSARVGHIRVSPHFYNTTSEIDTCFEAIGECLHR
jgi:cysteine desulfurase / selenocysteine lyase